MGTVDGYWSVTGFASKSHTLRDATGAVKRHVLIKYLLSNTNTTKEIIREHRE